MAIDWRRGLGLSKADAIKSVTWDEAKQTYSRLSKEADRLLKGTELYGMHVALDTFLALAKKELYR